MVMHIAVAMGAQRFGVGVAVDAFDRLLARGIDRRDDRDVGIVQAFGELFEGVAQARVAMRLHHGDHGTGSRPDARPSARPRS